MRRAAAAAALLLAASPGPASAAPPPASAHASPGLAELRHVVGAWRVRTDFLDADGAVARTADGTYEFEWAIADAVVRGIGRQPAPGGATAILLYVRPAAGEIEMVAVDQAGTRWVMTGREGSDVRTTGDRPMSDGSRMRLRFTRYDVAPDRFRSRMDYSTDGGATWIEGNRQTFVRTAPAGGR